MLFVFVLYKVGVQLGGTFLVTCGSIHVLLNIMNQKTYTYNYMTIL